MTSTSHNTEPIGVDSTQLVDDSVAAWLENSPRHRAEKEKNPRFLKTRRFLGRAALVGVCTIPVADLALSDAVGVKIYTEVNDAIDLDNQAAERSLEIGTNGGIIMLEVAGLGAMIARNRRMQKIFSRYDDYLEEKHEGMSKPRKALSYTLNSPFLAMKAVGERVETVGEKLDKTDNKILSVAGKTAVDAGMINVMGTNGVIMQEVVSGRPPSNKRIAWLSGLMAASWLGPAEGIRAAYERFPAVRPPIDAVGKAFETATTVNALHPWETPVASIAMGSIAVGLAISGHKLNKYSEQQDEKEATDSITS